MRGGVEGGCGWELGEKVGKWEVGEVGGVGRWEGGKVGRWEGGRWEGGR